MPSHGLMDIVMIIIDVYETKQSAYDDHLPFIFSSLPNYNHWIDEAEKKTVSSPLCMTNANIPNTSNESVGH